MSHPGITSEKFEIPEEKSLPECILIFWMFIKF